MVKSAESVNEIGTKQIRSTESGSKNNQAESDMQGKQGCPLKNIIRNIEQKGGKPSIGLLSSEIEGLSALDRAFAIKALQSTRGNRYVQRVVAQAKLVVSQPGDEYEQEAERVAEKVMSKSEGYVLQRKSPLHNEDDIVLKAKGLPGQAPSAISKIEATPSVREVLDSSSQTLSSATRTFMEPRFRRDFGNVRIHIGSQAAKLAHAVKALAFTVGRNIVFGPGRYAPDTREGQNLLAHELTHVVQQTGGALAEPHSYLQFPIQMRIKAHGAVGQQRSLDISPASELIQRREECDIWGNCQSIPDEPSGQDYDGTGGSPGYQGGFEGSPPTPEQWPTMPSEEQYPSSNDGAGGSQGSQGGYEGSYPGPDVPGSENDDSSRGYEGESEESYPAPDIDVPGSEEQYPPSNDEGAGGSRGYQGGFEGSPPTPEQWPVVPNEPPAYVPSPCDGQIWRPVSAWGISIGGVGSCGCRWKSVTPPPTGGPSVSGGNPGFCTRSEITGMGLAIPGDLCQCLDILDAEGDRYQGGSIPFTPIKIPGKGWHPGGPKSSNPEVARDKTPPKDWNY
jgi:hypothetical protein